MSDLSRLVDYGVLGLVLAWFMVRMEKKMDALIDAVQHLSAKP